jgi:hypothetical protein
MEATRNTSLEKQYTPPKNFLGDSVRPKGHEEERSLPSFLGGFRILSEAMKAKRPPKLLGGGGVRFLLEATKAKTPPPRFLGGLVPLGEKT